MAARGRESGKGASDCGCLAFWNRGEEVRKDCGNMLFALGMMVGLLLGYFISAGQMGLIDKDFCERLGKFSQSFGDSEAYRRIWDSERCGVEKRDF